MTAAEVRQRRAAAAKQYQPDKIRPLLVAQTPPEADDRYFYFPYVAQHDWLFRAVTQAILPHGEASRINKAALLAQLLDLGVFLIDLKPIPPTGPTCRHTCRRCLRGWGSCSRNASSSSRPMCSTRRTPRWRPRAIPSLRCGSASLRRGDRKSSRSRSAGRWPESDTAALSAPMHRLRPGAEEKPDE